MNLLLAIVICSLSAADAEAKADGGVGDCGGAGTTVEVTVDSKPRCFQLYDPIKTVPKPMPVIVFFHGKGGRASQSCNANGEMVRDAEAMGYALVCGDAYQDWQFPEIGGELGVTSAKPRPCAASDTPDATYVEKIFEKLAESTATYDATKIYFMGFSQGAMMTTWASICFHDKIRGAVQGGSALKLHGSAVTSEICTVSSNTKCKVGDDDGVGIPGGAGKCDTCNYFPLQPDKLNNVDGDPLKWCLYMGCDDYLSHSVNHMAEYLKILGAPYNLETYDSTHKAPTNWMTMVAKCHGIWTGSASDESGFTCGSSSFFVSGQMPEGGGGGGGGGSAGSGGSGAPAACSESKTTMCCGDGTCGGPETEDNCDADCTDGGGGAGGQGTPPACSTSKTTLCCGDGTCGGPETTDNCAADCSGGGSGGGPPPPPPGGNGGGGQGAPPACSTSKTTLCCGDGTCAGPETKANCAADCSGAGGSTTRASASGGQSASGALGDRMYLLFMVILPMYATA